MRLLVGIAKRFPTIPSDPDVVEYAARVSVWGRWLVWLVTVFHFAYRPGFWYYGHHEYLFFHVPLVLLNGLVHYRLLTKRSVTWCWLLILSTVDMFLITAGVIFQRGFEGFLFLAYYPALALFVLVFPSLGIGLAWTTMIAVAYTLICLMVGLGLDLIAGDEKELVARLASMYALVLCVSLIARFERGRSQAAIQQLEHVELSQPTPEVAGVKVHLRDDTFPFTPLCKRRQVAKLVESDEEWAELPSSQQCGRCAQRRRQQLRARTVSPVPWSVGMDNPNGGRGGRWWSRRPRPRPPSILFLFRELDHVVGRGRQRWRRWWWGRRPRWRRWWGRRSWASGSRRLGSGVGGWNALSRKELDSLLTNPCSRCGLSDRQQVIGPIDLDFGGRLATVLCRRCGFVWMAVVVRDS